MKRAEGAEPVAPADDDAGDGIHPALATYLDTVPAVPLATKDFDPLQYHLERRAESETKYLGCTLSGGSTNVSARNERTFSAVGHVLDELSVQLNPEMLESLTMIKRNWKLLLHTAKRTIQTTDHNGDPLFVEVEEQEVDWKPLMELYIQTYGKDPMKEAEKRRARAAPEAQPEAQPEASDNEVEEADEEESSNEDDDSDSGNGGGGGRQARKRQRVEPRQTRGKSKQAEVDKLQQTLPTASVCIEMNASMWPGEDPHFTDGVESVFLEDDSDAEDDVPMGEVLYGDCYVSGEWGLDAREVLRRYAENEATLQDAQGNPLNLDIDDPEEGEE